MTSKSLGGIFLTTNIPWDRASNMHGTFIRQNTVLQGCLNAWGKVFLILIDLQPHVRTTDEIESVRNWFETQVAGELHVVVLKAVKQEGRKYLSYLKSYFLPWPLPQINKETNARLAELIASCNVSRVLCHRLDSFVLMCRAVRQKKYRVSLDLDDIEHVAYSRYLATTPAYFTKPFLHLHSLRFVFWQWRALQLCNDVFLCSTSDVEKMEYYNTNARLYAIQNSLKDPGTRSSILTKNLNCKNPSSHEASHEATHSRKNILFVGNISYPPNQIGLEWFLNNVWPLVQKKKLLTHDYPSQGRGIAI